MNKAEKIWEAFEGELCSPPTDDMREALAVAVRTIAYQYQYYQCCKDDEVEDMVIEANTLYDIARDLDKMEIL
jgi:hypothetical protein